MGLSTPQQPTHADNEAVIEATFGWGMPAESTVSGANLTNWTHDNFGEDLLINVKMVVYTIGIERRAPLHEPWN